MADDKASATLAGPSEAASPFGTGPSLDSNDVSVFFQNSPVPKAYEIPVIEDPKWSILGTDCQVVQISLDGGETVESESGAMMYMSDGCKQSVSFAGFGSTIGGEFLKIKTNNTDSQRGYVGFTSSQPGCLIPVPTANYPQGISFQLGAWVASVGTVTTNFRLASTVSCAAACCGGIPFVVQSIRAGGAAGGTAFVGANGTIVQKDLAAGEELIADQASVVGFTNEVKIDVRRVGGFLYCCCSGEGLFNAVMTGPGTVWLQSMPISKLKKLINTPPKTNKKKNGGSDGAPAETEMSR